MVAMLMWQSGIDGWMGMEGLTASKAQNEPIKGKKREDQNCVVQNLGGCMGVREKGAGESGYWSDVHESLMTR